MDTATAPSVGHAVASARESSAVDLRVTQPRMTARAWRRRHPDLELVGYAGPRLPLRRRPEHTGRQDSAGGCCLYRPEVGVDSASGQAWVGFTSARPRARVYVNAIGPRRTRGRTQARARIGRRQELPRSRAAAPNARGQDRRAAVFLDPTSGVGYHSRSRRSRSGAWTPARPTARLKARRDEHGDRRGSVPTGASGHEGRTARSTPTRTNGRDPVGRDHQSRAAEPASVRELQRGGLCRPARPRRQRRHGASGAAGVAEALA